MEIAAIEDRLRGMLRTRAVPEDKLDGAIYQDMEINGYDFYELLCEIDSEFDLPEFDWGEFADMNEPPDGLTMWRFLTWRGPLILNRKRLTVAHLAKVIAEGKWSEP